MGRKAAPLNEVVGLAMDTQADLMRVQRHAAPLYEAAIATADRTLMAEVHELAAELKRAMQRARRLAGLADSMSLGQGSGVA